MSIEERMSQCILYNLRILSNAVKPTEQLEEVMTEGLFLKTNTNAFIHVTHYLFNILDRKEFKKKFYWPIIDKKSENSYRTNSVEFINMLIDRYSLSHEKIKQVTVVHPSGKKFMSLILYLIETAVKEVMKRKKINSGISLDMDKAESIVSTMSKIENDLIGNINTEIKTIRTKTAEIQELINIIYPSDECSLPFENFIENWHLLNKTRLENLKNRYAKVSNIIAKSNLLQEKAHRMLSSKKYEIVQPSCNEMKELADFYQHHEQPIDKQLNIVSLLLYLDSTLSIIQNYIRNFSYDEVEISHEEMSIVKRKLAELQVFERLFEKLTTKERELKEKITKFRAEKEERETSMEANQTMQDEDDKLIREAQGREVLRSLISPRYNFDASRNSMNCVMVKKNHLVFLDNAGTTSLDHSMMPSFNQSRLYRPLSDTMLNKSREMAPPKLNSKPPSRRRKRDPMQLMEQAISSTTCHRFDLNSTTNFTGAVPKMTSTPFSSTMRSPDLIHHANFSMISNISAVTQTPLSTHHFNQVVVSNLQVPQNTNCPVIPRPDVVSSEQIKDIPLNDEDKMKNLQRSPVTKTDPLVTLQEALGRPVLGSLDDNNLLAPPKLQINDETLCNSVVGFSSSINEETVCEKENFGADVNFDTILFIKKHGGDEDLFNVSDSILVENDSN